MTWLGRRAAACRLITPLSPPLHGLRFSLHDGLAHGLAARSACTRSRCQFYPQRGERWHGEPNDQRSRRICAAVPWSAILPRTNQRSPPFHHASSTDQRGTGSGTQNIAPGRRRFVLCRSSGYGYGTEGIFRTASVRRFRHVPLSAPHPPRAAASTPGGHHTDLPHPGRLKRWNARTATLVL